MRTVSGICLGAAIVLGATYAVAPRLVEPPQASAILAAATICVLVGVGSLLPVVLVAPKYPVYLPQAALATMVLRLFLTLGAGGLYYWVKEPPDTTYMTAMVVCYLLLLIVETGIAWRLAKVYWPSGDAST